eukprot:s2631_g2.t1
MLFNFFNAYFLERFLLRSVLSKESRIQSRTDTRLQNMISNEYSACLTGARSLHRLTCFVPGWHVGAKYVSI